MAETYDSFEQARPVVERLFALGNELSRVGLDSERGREIEQEVRSLFDPDLEHVTRDGVIRGPGHFLAESRIQAERFEISYEIELREARDAVVALATVMRRLRDSPSDYLKVHSGSIFRVRGGRIVFLEGYPDGRGALRAAGLDDRT